MTAPVTMASLPAGIGVLEFRDRVRELLAPVAAAFSDRVAAPSSSDRVAAVEELGDDHHRVLRRVRDLQARLYDLGLAWPSGPREYGGQDLTDAHDGVVDEVLEELGFPSREPLFVGLHIVAPALRHHAESTLQAATLPRLMRGELLACQLFSEPDAGSDLAGITTRGERDGDAWIVTGQKVWTSMGHVADVGEALVRTDPKGSKHGGLTMFLIDMDSPGVTVRPIRQMTGGSAFNEVFLDEVRVPDSRRIGEEGGGWTVATTSLGSERSSMSGSDGPVSAHVLARLHELLERLEVEAEPRHHDQVARAITSVMAMRGANHLTDASWPAGLAPVAGSVAKLLLVRAVDEIAALASQVLGQRAVIDDGTPGTFAWSEFVLGVPGLHLAGGTDEIQRTLVAQRGLGLPREPRPTR